MPEKTPVKMVKCPFTGKMVPHVPRVVAAPNTAVDVVAAEPLPTEVKQTRKDELDWELAGLRQKWVDIGPTKRTGAAGDKLMKKFRKLSLEYWHVTGNHPAPLDAKL